MKHRFEFQCLFDVILSQQSLQNAAGVTELRASLVLAGGDLVDWACSWAAGPRRGNDIAVVLEKLQVGDQKSRHGSLFCVRTQGGRFIFGNGLYIVYTIYLWWFNGI